jgi:hypothetical protein
MAFSTNLTMALTGITSLDMLDVTPGTAEAEKAVVLDSGLDVTGMDDVTITGDLAVGGGVTVTGRMNFRPGTAVNAVAAGGTLTVGGVALDGDYIEIGDDTYEFAADDALTVTVGNIAVDISVASTYTAKSQGTLTITDQPTSGNTMTIGVGAGQKEYTFVPDGTANADGEVSVGTDLPTAQANIVAAINGTDSVSTAHTQVTAAAFAANDCVISAIIAGAAGDTIATTETFTAGTNVFDGAGTLGTTQAGSDCSAADAVTALVSAITASDTEGVGAADGALDTVVLTADTAGTAANCIVTLADNMTNGTFAAGTLLGGIDGTVGLTGDILFNATNLYTLTTDNTVVDANWKITAL